MYLYTTSVYIGFGVLCAVRGETCHDVGDCDSNCFPPLNKICEAGQCYCTSSYCK